MPYLPHTLIAWGGTWDVPLDAEQWVCTLRTTSAFIGSEEENEDLLDELEAIINTFHASTLHSNVCLLEFIKANAIGPDGKYANPVKSFTREKVTPLAGTNSSPVLPLQNTVAVTLRTNAQRGLASRGRFYPPGVVTNEISSGRITQARAQARVAGAATLIASINALDTEFGTGQVGVISRGAGGGSGSGVSNPVTLVQVGRTVDTQRRRRKSIDEGPREQQSLS